jgi:hypothetical protein
MECRKNPKVPTLQNASSLKTLSNGKKEEALRFVGEKSEVWGFTALPDKFSKGYDGLASWQDSNNG